MAICEQLLTICKQKRTFHLKIITDAQEKIFKIVSKIGNFTFKSLVFNKNINFMQKNLFFSKIFYRKIRTSDCFFPYIPYIALPENYNWYIKSFACFYVVSLEISKDYHKKICSKNIMFSEHNNLKLWYLLI